MIAAKSQLLRGQKPPSKFSKLASNAKLASSNAKVHDMEASLEDVPKKKKRFIPPRCGVSCE